jgi:LacI family transcriptional regulator, galactose operon repressor
VGQSILQLGEMAAELLLRRIATPQLPIDQRIVTPSIVLRESTAPLAGVFAQYR